MFQNYTFQTTQVKPHLLGNTEFSEISVGQYDIRIPHDIFKNIFFMGNVCVWQKIFPEFCFTWFPWS